MSHFVFSSINYKSINFGAYFDTSKCYDVTGTFKVIVTVKPRSSKVIVKDKKGHT